MTAAMKTMLAVNFDTKRIVLRNNPLGRKAGEIATIEDGDKVIVYATFDVTDYQRMLMANALRSKYRGLGFRSFCDKLNYITEDLVKVSQRNEFDSIIQWQEQQLTRHAVRLYNKYLA